MLAADCERVCAGLPRRQWKLIEQIRESARGVHATIAEGNGRFSLPDYLRFLSMANGSLSELQSDLIKIRRAKPNDRAVKAALDRTYIVEKLLMRLVASLRRKRDGEGED
jgi:four helix bundle protein